MDTERRRYQRFPIMHDLAKPVELRFKTGSITTPVPAVLLDLSAGGMGILTFMAIDVGSDIVIRINLADLKIDVEGKVIWSLCKGETWRIGIAFNKINKDTIQKINRIAEDYNACEIKIGFGIKDVCFKECSYYALCTKPLKI